MSTDFGHRDWAFHPRAMKERVGGYLLLQNRDYKTCVWHVNSFSDLLGRLALALNDSQEEHRLKLLRQLRSKAPAKYREVMRMISDLQLNREELDPNHIFPCVATDEYIAGLPTEARHCNYCSVDFGEGYDVIWKLCGGHNFCKKCYINQLKRCQSPSFIRFF